MTDKNNDTTFGERVAFFNAVIDPLTMAETLTRVEEIIEKKIITQHVVINVAKLVLMQKDRQVRDIVNSCGLINADGQGVVWAAKFLGVKIPERVAGIDLMINLVKLSATKGYPIYFLGAKEAVVTKVIEIFKEQYPALSVAGYRNGYFSVDEEPDITKKIKQSNADILFVAMGTPKKEIFLNKYVKEMNVPFIMGVGGSFDVVAGITKRAPMWMQKAGLEWFYRFLCEPGRMWKRYLTTNTVFLGMVMKALITGKKGK